MLKQIIERIFPEYTNFVDLIWSIFTDSLNRESKTKVIGKNYSVNFRKRYMR